MKTAIPRNPVLLVHGGAWAIPADAAQAHRSGVRAALAAGWAVLARGGPAVDAVQAAVSVLEDDPTFDAGRGSFLTSDARVQCDALLMDGGRMKAGGVACVERLRNPIQAARIVLEQSPHVYFVGDGAERFAASHGMALIDNAELILPRERERLAFAKAREAAGLADETFSGPEADPPAHAHILRDDKSPETAFHKPTSLRPNPAFPSENAASTIENSASTSSEKTNFAASVTGPTAPAATGFLPEENGFARRETDLVRGATGFVTSHDFSRAEDPAKNERGASAPETSSPQISFPSQDHESGHDFSRAESPAKNEEGALAPEKHSIDSHDTVGAVALDSAGNLAAGTSTGGTLNKTPGRVGDSSLIGCGCYADNLSAAVSLTGWGEPIMKLVLGKWATDRVAQGTPPELAARQAIDYLSSRLQGHGGIILLAPDGRFGFAHNTPHMAWGLATLKGLETGLTIP